MGIWLAPDEQRVLFDYIDCDGSNEVDRDELEGFWVNFSTKMEASMVLAATERGVAYETMEKKDTKEKKKKGKKK